MQAKAAVRAKAACLCSYCCNRHLCHDGGRLGRVKIVTLRVGAPLLLTRPIFSPLFEFQHALSRAKHSCARRKRLHCRLLCSTRVRTMVSLALGGAEELGSFVALNTLGLWSCLLHKALRRIYHWFLRNSLFQVCKRVSSSGHWWWSTRISQHCLQVRSPVNFRLNDLRAQMN